MSPLDRTSGPAAASNRGGPATGACRQKTPKIGELRVEARMTETRVSVAGRRNFSKTDKRTFIATYRKRLITYGR